MRYIISSEEYLLREHTAGSFCALVLVDGFQRTYPSVMSDILINRFKYGLAYTIRKLNDNPYK